MTCCTVYQGYVPRNFWTKDEKIEMLSEYKEALQKEVQAVEERIAALNKA